MHTTKPRFATLLLFVMTCLLAACPAFAHDGETEHLEGEAREIAGWLIANQRAAWERFDAEAYRSMWDDDAVRIWQRIDEPNDDEIRFEIDSFLQANTMLMQGENPGIHLSFPHVSVEVDEDNAVLQWRVIIEADSWVYKELLGERFVLKRSDDGWSIVENRAWLVATDINGEKTRFDEAEWNRRDAAVEQAAETGDLHAHLYALLDAYRIDEAYEVIKAVTQGHDAMPRDWAMRGWLAVISIDNANDAEPSFRKALELDPDFDLYPFAKGMLDKPQADKTPDE